MKLQISWGLLRQLIDLLPEFGLSEVAQDGIFCKSLRHSGQHNRGNRLRITRKTDEVFAQTKPHRFIEPSRDSRCHGRDGSRRKKSSPSLVECKLTSNHPHILQART
jgi:hypothetical protein